MSNSKLTLAELSQKSKTHFESREWQEAANCLNEARERFPMEEGTLVQDSDGSIKLEVEDGKGGMARRDVTTDEG